MEMSLSQAMRLGSMLKPQGYGPFTPFSSCALRAAGDALGMRTIVSAPMERLRVRYPWLRGEFTCPQCFAVRMGTRVIWHLNDQHRWTREQIADQVEIWEKQIELAQDAARVPEHLAVAD